MNKQHCSQPDCDFRTGCQMGEMSFNECQYHNTNGDTTTSDSGLENPTPWHGSVLGLADLQHVAARGRPHLIGLIGAHNAGKTSFLTSVYLKLFHGACLSDKMFAGSFTLQAWEHLANNLRYPNHTAPMFPRHTPNTDDRVPGLLHLAFRNKLNRIEDYLFTDAPGEWFSNWSQNSTASNSKGARWIVQNSDVFLFFVDCAELAGENVGAARNAITQLAQRMADEVESRSVLILWSKNDIVLPSGIRQQLMARLDKCLPNARHLNISVKEADLLGIQSVAQAVLAQEFYRGQSIDLTIPCNKTSPFFAFRNM